MVAGPLHGLGPHPPRSRPRRRPPRGDREQGGERRERRAEVRQRRLRVRLRGAGAGRPPHGRGGLPGRHARRRRPAAAPRDPARRARPGAPPGRRQRRGQGGRRARSSPAWERASPTRVWRPSAWRGRSSPRSTASTRARCRSRTMVRTATELGREIRALDPRLTYSHLATVTELSRELFCSSEGALIDQTFALTQGMAYVVGTTAESSQELYDVVGHQRGLGDPDRRRARAVHGAARLPDVRPRPRPGGGRARGRPRRSPRPTGTSWSSPIRTTTRWSRTRSSAIPASSTAALKMEMAYAGRSWLLGGLDDTQVGRPIASPLVSAYSDPALPGYGHYAYDHDGTPARRVVHIDRGVFRGFLNSRQTAAIFGGEPNGHYKAADASLVPLIRMSNTVFAAGRRRPPPDPARRRARLLPGRPPHPVDRREPGELPDLGAARLRDPERRAGTALPGRRDHGRHARLPDERRRGRHRLPSLSHPELRQGTAHADEAARQRRPDDAKPRPAHRRELMRLDRRPPASRRIDAMGASRPPGQDVSGATPPSARKTDAVPPGPTTAELARAAREALDLLRAVPDVLEAEVFVAANGQLLARLAYASHLPSNGVEEPKSTASHGIGLQVVFRGADGPRLGFGSEPSDLSREGVRRALAKAREGAVHDPAFVSLPRAGPGAADARALPRPAAPRPRRRGSRRRRLAGRHRGPPDVHRVRAPRRARRERGGPPPPRSPRWAATSRSCRSGSPSCRRTSRRSRPTSRRSSRPRRPAWSRRWTRRARAGPPAPGSTTSPRRPAWRRRTGRSARWAASGSGRAATGSSSGRSP